MLDLVANSPVTGCNMFIAETRSSGTFLLTVRGARVHKDAFISYVAGSMDWVPTHDLRYDASLACIVTVTVACSLGISYFFVLDQRVATNATWYTLIEDALKNPFKAREQWVVVGTKETLYGGMKKKVIQSCEWTNDSIH